MVPYHLLIKSREGANNYDNVERIGHEVAASVYQRPDVQVTWRVHAVIIVEHGLTVSADFEHGKSGDNDAEDGVDRADEVGSIVTLLLLGKLLIPLIQPDVESMEHQVQQAIECHHVQDEVEEMRHFVRRVLCFG